MKFKYEQKYQEWSEKWNDITKEIMRPVRRNVVVVLPNCIAKAMETMTEEEANIYISNIVEAHLHILLHEILRNAEKTGGTKDA